MQSIHNSQLICLHSLISYLSPAKALLKQSRVVYKVCATIATIAHLYPVPLTLAQKNELPWHIKLIKPINQKIASQTYRNRLQLPADQHNFYTLKHFIQYTCMRNENAYMYV